MRLTTKGRYAVTAMLDLAIHAHDAPVALADIAARQDISLAYLEQLFARLRRGGLVCSTRGPGGGYRLAREADAIAVAEVIAAVNENVDYTRCGGSADCQRQAKCLTHGLWAELSDQIQGFLAGITLSDVMRRPTVQAVAARQDRLLDERRVEFSPAPVARGRRASRGVVS